MAFALEREKSDGIVVIAVILRTCPWEHEVASANQALPTGGQPNAAADRHPHDRDTPWKQVYDGLVAAERYAAGNADTPPGLSGRPFH